MSYQSGFARFREFSTDYLLRSTLLLILPHFVLKVRRDLGFWVGFAAEWAARLQGAFRCGLGRGERLRGRGGGFTAVGFGWGEEKSARLGLREAGFGPLGLPAIHLRARAREEGRGVWVVRGR